MQTQLQTKQRIKASTKIILGLMLVSGAMIAAAFLGMGIDSLGNLTANNEEIIVAEVSHENLIQK